MKHMKLSIEEIDRRVKIREVYEQSVVKLLCVRAATRNAMLVFDDVLPDCREASLAITNLEQALHWANAAITRTTTTSDSTPNPA